MIFIAQAVASIVDPIALIGYVIAGAAPKRWWIALLCAAGWAVVMEVIVLSGASAIGANFRFGDLLAPRILGALVIAGIVFLIANAVRRRRGHKPTNETQK